MKKLVLKTAGITLAVIIMIAGLIFGAFAIFSPKTLAKFFDGAGNYSLSVIFYEKQYNKTQDISDLYVLSVKLDDEKDAEKTQKYLAEFLSSEGVKDYCANFDNIGSGIKTYDYLNGKYVCALYSVKGITDTIIYLENSVKTDYNDFNGYSILLGEFSDTLTTEDLSKILTSLNGLSIDSEYKTRDINIVKSLMV